MNKMYMLNFISEIQRALDDRSSKTPILKKMVEMNKMYMLNFISEIQRALDDRSSKTPILKKMVETVDEVLMG